MKITEIEKTVIQKMLADRELKPIRSTVNFDAVKVSDRHFTGHGFMSDFEPSMEVKLFDNKVSLRWGKVGARLNASKLDTGYLIYIDNGYLVTVEGYTYGDRWPDQIDQIEFYEWKPGMET